MNELSLEGPEQHWMQRAIELSQEALEHGGGPFGAVVVQGQEIVGEGFNQVAVTNDPTAHAEVMAIRDACRKLNHFQLTGSVIFASCEPCPMCLGAIYWARIDQIIYGCTRQDAAAIGFDDALIYEEISRPLAARRIPMQRFMASQAQHILRKWIDWPDKREY